MNIKILQHCFGKKNSGGPINAFNRFMESSSIPYEKMLQEMPANGINFKLIVDFYRIIKKVDPSLMHVRGLGNEGFHAAIAAYLARVPFILVSVHGSHRDLLYPQSKIKNFIVVKILESITLNIATHIATVCKYAADRDFVAKRKNKYVGFVPNGAPPPIYFSDISEKYKFKINNNIDSNFLVGLCVSRVTKEKGYFVLLEALKRAELKNLKLCIVIVGAYEDEIKEVFSSVPGVNVVFFGHRGDVDYFYRVADFYIFPTLHENLSNSLIEALSYKLPVIATSVGGNTEVIEGGGGVLIPPNDPESLSKAIFEMVSNEGLRENLSIEAEKNYMAHYTQDAMVFGWENMYKKILGVRDLT